MTEMLPTITENLPPLYRKLVPLTAEHHGQHGLSSFTDYHFAAGASSFPLGFEEFAAAQRHYPILFTDGELPMPAVLLSVESGRNPYVDRDGQWTQGAYVPAYVRRFPFTLIRARAGDDEFALCVDPMAELFGYGFERRLFQSGKATDLTDRIMEFCVAYERSIAQTRAVCAELKALDLFTEPSIKISRDGKSLALKGLKIIDEVKLRALPDATLARLARSGVIGSISAHLFSLASISQLQGLRGALERIDVDLQVDGTIDATIELRTCGNLVR